MRPVGIVANPVSGRDVRRLVTNAATSTLDDKVGIVRRILVGAFEAGATQFMVLPEPHGIHRRAMATLPFAGQLEVVDALGRVRHHDERDTVGAAVAMADADCAAVVVLGGDGTNRAFAAGWRDAPLIPLSTGTNNAFPATVEATSAGAAAGHLAVGRVRSDEVSARAKVVRVSVDDGDDDLALIDAVLLAEPPHRAGSLEPFDPTALVAAVLSRADPGAVGVSSIGGVVDPVGAGDGCGLELRFRRDGCAGTGGDTLVRSPLAPGTYAEVAVERWRRLALGEQVTFGGPGLLALDGDRRRIVGAGGRARLRVERTGPRVIEVARVVAHPHARAHWRGASPGRTS